VTFYQNNFFGLFLAFLFLFTKMEGPKMLVGSRALDALDHHAQAIKQRKSAKAPSQNATTNALDYGVGWLVGPTSADALINCIACTEFANKELVEAGGDVDLVTNPPNWEEESKFVGSVLPQGLSARGLYFCFVDDSNVEQREALLNRFFEKNAQALRSIFAAAGSTSIFVAAKALHPTEEQDEAHARPAFYRLALGHDAASPSLEQVSNVEVAKAGQVLRDFGLFRTRLSLPVRARDLGS